MLCQKNSFSLSDSLFCCMAQKEFPYKGAPIINISDNFDALFDSRN